MKRALTTGVALASMLIAKPGWAQEPEAHLREAQAIAHREAGQAHYQGAPGGDRDGFEKCGQAFLDIYNTFESHPRPDRLLWNAAECFHAAGMVGAANQARTLLLERHHDSEFAQNTLLYLAEAHATIADYAPAAERYEQYADRYSKDHHAVDALQNAYLFRVGLSQREQAERDLEKYEALYAGKNLPVAAQIFWSRQSLLDSDKARRAHASEYLSKYGQRGGVDRMIVAEAVIAQIDWRRSCSEVLLHDSCITVARERLHPSVAAAPKRERASAKQNQRYRPPKRCGAATRAITTVHRRNAKLREDAQARFKRILKLANGRIEIPADDRARHEAFQLAWGMAMFYQADALFEDYLGLQLPKDPTAERSLWEFVERKHKLGQELQQRYAEIKMTGHPHFMLAGAARAALVLQSFADQLHRIEVPRSLRSEAEVEGFCTGMAAAAEPYDEAALAAWEYCLQRSTEYQFFNEFSRLCEDELIQRGKAPATVELFGEPMYASSRAASVGVLDEAQAKRLNPP